MTNLTSKEAQALRAIADIGLDAMGGNEPGDLRDDNMSWFSPRDLAQAMGCNEHVASGLVSSLEAKGLVDGGDPEWYLSDAGITMAEMIAASAAAQSVGG